MPVRSNMYRAESTSSIFRDRELRSSGTDSLYSDDKKDNMYVSSPDLSQGSIPHTRSSSTDSMDGSYYGNHSRQSSGSTETYLGRNATNPRRVSASGGADPLYFVKVKKNDDLAKEAEKQMTAAAEVNKMRKSVGETNEEPEWQSNFDSWKSKLRRKSHHLRDYVGVEEDEEEPASEERKVKTFSEIMAEKEKRKSMPALRSFYPLEDEVDFPKAASSGPAVNIEVAKSQVKKLESEPLMSQKKSKSAKENIAPWAKDSEEEGGSQSDSSEVKSNDMDNVFHETSANKVSQEKEKPWMRRADTLPATKVTDTKRYSAPVKVNKSLSSRKNDLWVSKKDSSPSGSKFEGGSRQQSQSDKVSKFVRNFEDKDQKSATVSAPSKRQDFPNQATKSFEFNAKNTSPRRSFDSKARSTPPLRSFDSRDKPAPSSLSFSERTTTSPKQPSPLSPLSPKALLPKDQRFRRSSSESSPSSSFSFTSPSLSNSSPQKVPPPTKNTIEKTIKISQKPNNSKGFGFFITGGMDQREPVVVTRVSLGSSADVNELQAKDEIVNINGRDVENFTHAQTQHMIDNSVKRGQIELKVKRSLSDEEDFDSMDEEETPATSLKADLSASSAETENHSYNSRSQSQPSYADRYTGQRYSPQPNNTSFKSSSEQVPDVVRMDQDDSSQPLMDQLLAEKKREANNNDFKQFSSPELKEEERSSRRSPVVEESVITASLVSSVQVTPSTFDQWTADIQAPVDHLVNEERPTIRTRRPSPIRSAPEPYTPPQTNNQVTPIRTEVTMRRSVQTPPTPPPPRAGPPSLSSHEAEDSEDSGTGPPAALLRWQRRRPKSEYFLSTPSEPTPVDKEYSQDDSLLSRTVQDFETTVRTQKPLPPQRNTYHFEDFRKMEDWDKKQEEERKPWKQQEIEIPQTQPKFDVIIEKQPQTLTAQRSSPDTVSMPGVELTFNVKDNDEMFQNQEKFERDQQRIIEQYEVEKRRAKDADELKQKEEQKLLQLDTSLLAQSKPSSVEVEEPVQRTNIEPVQSSIKTVHEAPQYNSEPMTIHLSSVIPGRHLVIDPRNLEGQSDPNLPEYSFHVDLNKASAPQPLAAPQPVAAPQFVSATHHVSAPQPVRQEPVIDQDILQREKQRIQDEERRKFDEERRQWAFQQQQMVKEQEELRKEKERLEMEKERLRHEEAMIEQRRQQVEPHGAPRHHQPVVSNINHNLYSSPRSSLSSSGSSMSPSPRSPPHALDPRLRDSSIRKSDSNLGAPPVAPKPGRGSAGEKARLTREDLLAMNRKATPMQTKPPESDNSSSSYDADHISREAPSKGELHSLNAVPRQRVRSSADWIKGEEPEQQYKERPYVIGNRSDVIGNRSDVIHQNYSNPQDHWVVREAEKRRLAEQSQKKMGNSYSSRAHTAHTAHTGPIKPFTSSSVNKWKSETDTPQNRYSFHASSNSEVRQPSPRPFSVENSGVSQYDDSLDRKPTQFSARAQQSPHQQMSQTLPHNFSFNANNIRKGEVSSASPSYPPARSPSSHAEVMSVSGKQLCSHCGQELGFGAAMVIESLGLYYHVQCFCCCVCRTPLGNGSEGADVRVRVNKLHCRNCYSNDEAGLKFSKV